MRYVIYYSDRNANSGEGGDDEIKLYTPDISGPEGLFNLINRGKLVRSEHQDLTNSNPGKPIGKIVPRMMRKGGGGGKYVRPKGRVDVKSTDVSRDARDIARLKHDIRSRLFEQTPISGVSEVRVTTPDGKTRRVYGAESLPETEWREQEFLKYRPLSDRSKEIGKRRQKDRIATKKATDAAIAEEAARLKEEKRDNYDKSLKGRIHKFLHPIKEKLVGLLNSADKKLAFNASRAALLGYKIPRSQLVSFSRYYTSPVVPRYSYPRFQYYRYR